MTFDQIPTTLRASLLNNALFQREHFYRLVGSLDASEVPEGDRLREAVTRAKEGIDGLVYLLAERPKPPADLTTHTRGAVG